MKNWHSVKYTTGKYKYKYQILRLYDGELSFEVRSRHTSLVFCKARVYRVCDVPTSVQLR